MGLMPLWMQLETALPMPQKPQETSLLMQQKTLAILSWTFSDEVTGTSLGADDSAPCTVFLFLHACKCYVCSLEVHMPRRTTQVRVADVLAFCVGWTVAKHSLAD